MNWFWGMISMQANTVSKTIEKNISDDMNLGRLSACCIGLSEHLDHFIDHRLNLIMQVCRDFAEYAMRVLGIVVSK